MTSARRISFTTIRTHDQFNSTIYGLNDRYRGVFDGRRVLFLNPLDMQARNLHAGQIVDIYSHFEGEIRKAPRFAIVPYAIARRSAAAYYPETNVLVPSAALPLKAISLPPNASHHADSRRSLRSTTVFQGRS